MTSNLELNYARENTTAQSRTLPTAIAYRITTRPEQFFNCQRNILLFVIGIFYTNIRGVFRSFFYVCRCKQKQV
jgi:hypothetical protein